jgi:pyrroloquinoline quinone (PQQ) biosynthesis protein C
VKNRSSTLLGEAFSDNERNFWPDDIENCFKERLGIEKIWKKLSRESQLQSALGTSNESMAEQLARKRLNELLERRNDIIHRGRSYYTASQSEVRQYVTFAKNLVEVLAEVMEKQLTAI